MEQELADFCIVQVAQGHKERSRNRDGREHTDEHAKTKDQSKTFNDSGTWEVIKHDSGNNTWKIAVANRKPSAWETLFNGIGNRKAAQHFLLHSFKNQNVRVHRHTDRKDESGQTGRGQRDRDEFEDKQWKGNVDQKWYRCKQTRQTVPKDQEKCDHDKSNDSGERDGRGGG